MGRWNSAPELSAGIGRIKRWKSKIAYSLSRALRRGSGYRRRSLCLIAARKSPCSLAAADALKELAQKLPGSLPVTVDMTQFDRVREAVGAVHRHYGRIDGLVNNAGRSYAAAVEEIDPALFDEIFHLNVLGPIVAMQAVIPLMRAQGGGSIVNINSGTAFMTVPQYSVYSASKRALLGFSSYRARRVGKGPHRRQRNLPIHHGDEFRQEQDGQSGRRRARGSIMPMVTSPNSSPASFCRLSKKDRLSISRMIVFAKWPGPAPRTR